jgi:hypothetical protein
LGEKRKGEGKMNKKAFGLSLSFVLLICTCLSAQADDHDDFLFEKGDIYATPMAGAIFYLDDSQREAFSVEVHPVFQALSLVLPAFYAGFP